MFQTTCRWNSSFFDDLWSALPLAKMVVLAVPSQARVDVTVVLFDRFRAHGRDRNHALVLSVPKQAAALDDERLQALVASRIKSSGLTWDDFRRVELV